MKIKLTYLYLIMLSILLAISILAIILACIIANFSNWGIMIAFFGGGFGAFSFLSILEWRKNYANNK